MGAGISNVEKCTLNIDKAKQRYSITNFERLVNRHLIRGLWIVTEIPLFTTFGEEKKPPMVQ